MAGRTERVNAKDILDRVDGIVFEGDVVRGWIEQLERRARGMLKAASTNRYFDEEWQMEYRELSAAMEALQRAARELELFRLAAAKREGKDVEPVVELGLVPALVDADPDTRVQEDIELTERVA
ncbi:MAG: hypothetical protein ACFB9M_15280 [Myxococcota bacterium]